MLRWRDTVDLVLRAEKLSLDLQSAESNLQACRNIKLLPGAGLRHLIFGSSEADDEVPLPEQS